MPTLVTALGVGEVTEDGDTTCDCTNEASALAYSCERVKRHVRGFSWVGRMTMDAGHVEVDFVFAKCKPANLPIWAETRVPSNLPGLVIHTRATATRQAMRHGTGTEKNVRIYRPIEREENRSRNCSTGEVKKERRRGRIYVPLWRMCGLVSQYEHGGSRA